MSSAVIVCCGGGDVGGVTFFGREGHETLIEKERGGGETGRKEGRRPAVRSG